MVTLFYLSFAFACCSRASPHLSLRATLMSVNGASAAAKSEEEEEDIDGAGKENAVDKNENVPAPSKVAPVNKKTVNKRNKFGEAPLHIACKRGDPDRACALLSSGADPNARDHNGWTPLHEACVAGSAECVRALLAAPSLDVAAAGGEGGETPLHEAAERGNAEAAEALLRAVKAAESSNKFGGLTARYKCVVFTCGEAAGPRKARVVVVGGPN